MRVIDMVRMELESWTGLRLTGLLLALSSPCFAQPAQPVSDTSIRLDPETWANIEREIMTEARESGREPFVIYRTSYVNLVLAGDTSEQHSRPVALVAGSHQQNFPYSGTRPWDNVLLKVGEDHLFFAEMETGRALKIQVGTGKSGAAGARIQFAGEMTSASTGEKVPVEMDIPASLAPHRMRRLGKPYQWVKAIASSWTSPDLLGHDILPCLRWRPSSLTSESGTIRIRGKSVAVNGIHGELEDGLLTNLNWDRFAISYDYVAVAAPGPEGYAFVDFTSHTLRPEGTVGRLMDWYARTTGSDCLTLVTDAELPANARGVQRPAASDASVLLFETRIDLGLASLRRQMIRTADPSGCSLFGLREIFEASRS